MKSPAFQFYPQDFLVGTADLTAEEVGGYIRLLCYQWSKGGLPNDQVKLTQLAGCQANATASIWHKFGICQDGMIRNERLERERDKQREFRERQAENAKKGWKIRKSDATALPGHMPENAKPMPPHDSGICQNDALQSSSSDHIYKGKRFKSPTLEEVKLLGAKAGLPESESERFFNYYESNGWMVGKNKMKKIGGALANWRSNWQSKPGTQPPTANGKIRWEDSI